MPSQRLAILLVIAGFTASTAFAARAPGTVLAGLGTAPDSPSADAHAAGIPPDTAAPGETPPAATQELAIPAAPSLAESNTRPSRGTGAASDDSAITAEINSRLKGDPRMESTDIRVSSVNGTVILSGSTSTDEARQAAEEVALQVEGVTRVENRLSAPSSANTIKERSQETLQHTERVASDSWITTKIRSSLLADPITKGMNIGVKTMEGVVSLSGRVDSQAEYDRAQQLASGIKGVKRVNATELKVGKAE